MTDIYEKFVQKLGIRIKKKKKKVIHEKFRNFFPEFYQKLFKNLIDILTKCGSVYMKCPSNLNMLENFP